MLCASLSVCVRSCQVLTASLNVRDSMQHFGACVHPETMQMKGHLLPQGCMVTVMHAQCSGQGAAYSLTK